MPQSSRSPGGPDVVERFYAAVNETIATGNPGALRRVVNPSFTDENPLPGVNPGRAGLEAYLVSLHRSDPGLRLEAEVLVRRRRTRSWPGCRCGRSGRRPRAAVGHWASDGRCGAQSRSFA